MICGSFRDCADETGLECLSPFHLIIVNVVEKSMTGVTIDEFALEIKYLTYRPRFRMCIQPKATAKFMIVVAIKLVAYNTGLTKFAKIPNARLRKLEIGVSMIIEYALLCA